MEIEMPIWMNEIIEEFEERDILKLIRGIYKHGNLLVNQSWINGEIDLEGLIKAEKYIDVAIYLSENASKNSGTFKEIKFYDSLNFLITSKKFEIQYLISKNENKINKQLNDLQKAIENIEKAISISEIPENVKFWEELLNILKIHYFELRGDESFHERNFKKAIKFYRKGLKHSKEGLKSYLSDEEILSLGKYGRQEEIEELKKHFSEKRDHIVTSSLLMVADSERDNHAKTFETKFFSLSSKVYWGESKKNKMGEKINMEKAIFFSEKACSSSEESPEIRGLSSSYKKERGKKYPCKIVENEHYYLSDCELFIKHWLGRTGISPGFKASYQCSICNLDIRDDNCSHITGEIYNGEVARAICKDIEIEEVAMVHVPRDRRARTLSIALPKQWFNKMFEGAPEGAWLKCDICSTDDMEPLNIIGADEGEKDEIKNNS